MGFFRILAAVFLVTTGDAALMGYKVDREVEVIWEEAKPGAPLLLILHGSSKQAGAGSYDFAQFGYWKEHGISVAAISLPGYGLSTGPYDFGGPATMRALREGIASLQRELQPSKIGVLGFGIGAHAALLLPLEEPSVAFVLSTNGKYDVTPLVDEGHPFLKLLRSRGYVFSNSFEELQRRSPQSFTDHYKIPLFLMHRMSYSLVPEQGAIHFADEVNLAGGECTLFLLPGGAQDPCISHDIVITEAGDWVLEQFGKS